MENKISSITSDTVDGKKNVTSIYRPNMINTIYKKKNKKKNKTISLNIIVIIVIFVLLIVSFILFLKISNTSQNVIKSGEYSEQYIPPTAKPQGELKVLDEIDEVKLSGTNKEKFQQIINEIQDEEKNYGKYSLYIKIIETGDEYAYNENEEYFAASLFKAPLAVAALKDIEDEVISFDTKFRITQEDIQEGSGVLQNEKPGTEITVERLLEELIKNSDNTAQFVLQRSLSLKSQQEAFNLADEYKKNSKYFSENISTPKEISNFFETLDKAGYINVESKKYLYKLMINTSFDDRISIHLENPLKFGHKIGNWPEEGSWHDCGIVFGSRQKAVVCVMSEDTTFEGFLVICKLVAVFVNGLF